MSLLQEGSREDRRYQNPAETIVVMRELSGLSTGRCYFIIVTAGPTVVPVILINEES